MHDLFTSTSVNYTSCMWMISMHFPASFYNYKFIYAPIIILIHVLVLKHDNMTNIIIIYIYIWMEMNYTLYTATR